MLVEFEQNRMVQNFELFDQKKKTRGFKNHFWQSVDVTLEDYSVAESIV